MLVMLDQSNLVLPCFELLIRLWSETDFYYQYVVGGWEAGW